MEKHDILSKALGWIDAVESGKKGYYAGDIQTVSDGYTFQIIHGSKSMRFFFIRRRNFCLSSRE